MEEDSHQEAEEGGEYTEAKVRKLNAICMLHVNDGRGISAAPAAPVRPASPLPPNVPTGPRNQNKYKDRDGNAPAVDGLDYGGGKDPMGRRTPSGEPEERISRYVKFVFLGKSCKFNCIQGNDGARLVWMISVVQNAVEGDPTCFMSQCYLYISTINTT